MHFQLCNIYIYLSHLLYWYIIFLWGVAWWGWELEFILDNIERSVAIGDMNQYIWLLFSPYNEDKFRINFGCMHNLPCMQDVIVRKQIIINRNNHQICEYSMETGMVKSGFFFIKSSEYREEIYFLECFLYIRNSCNRQEKWYNVIFEIPNVSDQK